MKTINEYIINKQDNQIDESFLSVGLTIIVAMILAKFTFKGIAVIKAMFDAVKEGVSKGKEYMNAINSLNELLQPYKDDLMKTEWGSKLFTKEGIINNASVKEKGCAMVYFALQDDIKATLSKEDFDKFEHIIKPIKEIEHMEMMGKLNL